MKQNQRKLITIMVLAIILALLFSSVAMAAGVPKYIYYRNAANELVRADYQQAEDNLFPPVSDSSLMDAIRNKLRENFLAGRAIYVEDEDGQTINYLKAARDGLTYAEAYFDSDYWVGQQTPVKELIIDPVTGDPVEVSLIRVDSVSAVNDPAGNTFTVTAELTAEPATVPVAGDFDVVVEIDGVVAPAYNTFSWSAANLEATFTWAAIQPITTEQQVDFSVAYKDTSAVSGTIFIDPIVIVVESVEAIDRTTIEVTLAAGSDPVAAADEDNYEVTVGGADVLVTAVVYDTTTRIATLTVDLTGFAGACVVNGVTAAVDVPPVPVFQSIITAPGSFKVVLNFNTEVYDLNNNLVPANFAVTTDGNPNVVTAVEVAASAGDAEDTITLTVTDPTIGNTVTEVRLLAAGAAKVVNIWDEAAAAATRWELTPEDTDAPLFTGVRAVEGGYTIYIDFSEAVHTNGNALSASTAAGDDVRVTLNTVRVAAQGNTVAGIAVADATSSIKVDLDLPYDDLLASGDPVGVTLASVLQDDTVARHIRDLSDNAFEGLRTRSATFITGPGLKNAADSTLLYNGDIDLELEVTLDGVLAAGETITVYLEDMDNNGFDFVNGAVAVTGSTGAAAIVDTDKVVFIAPAAGVADNTTLTFTIEEGGAAGEYVFTGAQAINNSPHDIVFQRSDVGTIAEAEVMVIEGFSGFSADNLVSSKDGQPFSFQFDLEGALAAGKKIEMDLSVLAAKVDFSAVNAAQTEIASTIGGAAINTTNHTVTKSGDKLFITAGAGGIATGTTVVINLRDVTPSANIIDVAAGAAGQHNLILTRDDSGASAPFKVTILGNIIDGSASSLSNNTANQTQNISFNVDGDLAMNQFVDIKITDSKTVEYTGDTADYVVTGANAQVVSVTPIGLTVVDPTIRVRANELITSGTELTVNVGGATGVDTTGVNDTIIEVEIERLDNNESDTFTFEVGSYTGSVTVYDAISLQNALNDPDISTIIIAGNINVGGPFTANIDGQTILGDGYTVTGDLTVAGDNITMSNITIDGNLTIDGDDFTGVSITVTGLTTINGANASFSSTLNNVTVAATGSATFTNVTITGDLIVNGTATLVGSTTVAGTITVGPGGEIDASITTKEQLAELLGVEYEGVDIIQLGANIDFEAEVVIERDVTIDLNEKSLKAHHILIKNAEVVIENGELVPDTTIANWYDQLGGTHPHKYFVRTDRTVTGGDTTTLVLDTVAIDGNIVNVAEDITMVLIGNAGRADEGMGDGGIVATDSLTVINCDLNITKQTNYSAYAIYTFATSTTITGNDFNESFRAIGIDGAFTPTASIEDNDFTGVTADTLTHFFIVPYSSASSGDGFVTVNEVQFGASDAEATVKANLENVTDDFSAEGNTFGNGTTVLASNNESFSDEIWLREHDGINWGDVFEYTP